MVTVSSVSVGAQDACPMQALHTVANVSVSDGKNYQVEGLYNSKHQAATIFVGGNGSTNVVEGPYAWSSSAEGEKLGGNFLRDFVLGHQFHAFLWHFDDLVQNIEIIKNIDFDGGHYAARRGVLDTGGFVSLVDPDKERPEGLRFELGDFIIDITFNDWRFDQASNRTVPYALLVDDGQRSFNYRYQYIDATAKPLMWFYQKVPQPNIDAVEIYRLHRKQLIAHCLGDAEVLAKTLAANVIMANSGSTASVTLEQTKTVFANNVFQRRKYSTYSDLKYPVIEIGDAGDIGWAIVELQTTGMNVQADEPFDEQWAWTTLVKKIDGEWKMVGNTSNRK